IATMWTMLYQAHQGSSAEAARARQALMQRYCGAVYRYLLSAVRDPNVADDLTQEFALRFIQGRFRQAAPEHGRFRNYSKPALFHLVSDWRSRQNKAPRHLEEEASVSGPDESFYAEQAFRESWRQELLSRAWKALEQHQAQTGQPFYEVLHFRVQHP